MARSTPDPSPGMFRIMTAASARLFSGDSFPKNVEFSNTELSKFEIYDKKTGFESSVLKREHNDDFCSSGVQDTGGKKR